MMIFGWLFDAAVIGLIIAAMNKGEFPGWPRTIGCVFAIGFASGGVTFLLPERLAMLGLVAGAAVGTLVIAWLCDMALGRAAIAASIYLGVRVLLALGVMFLMSA